MSAFKLKHTLMLLAVLNVAVNAAEQQALPESVQQETSAGKSAITSPGLTTTELNHAKQWKLSKDEYERFKEVLKSPRAYFTPNIEKNPLLALALESESEIERQKYADRWVQMQFDNNVKVIAWQLEVTEAWRRLYPGVPRFSYKNPETAHYAIANQENPFSSPTGSNSARSGTGVINELLADKPRAQLYIAVAGCSDCVSAYKRQYEALKSGKIAGVDVHFTGSPSKQQIIDWAVANQLDASDVNDKRVVTLNVAEKAVPKVPAVEFN